MADNNCDNAELTEMLMFLADWLAANRDARIALDPYIGRAHASRSVRDDLYRFGDLLGDTYAPRPDDSRLARLVGIPRTPRACTGTGNRRRNRRRSTPEVTSKFVCTNRPSAPQVMPKFICN